MNEPVWASTELAYEIHEWVISKMGGTLGIRDEGLLESALSRPRNAYAYGEIDLYVLAAKYASGICKNHPFIDGNKRTAFTVAYIFLMDNGFKLIADEKVVDIIMVDLATGKVSEDEFATWLSKHTEKIIQREDDE